MNMRLCNTCLHVLEHRYTKRGNLVCTRCLAPHGGAVK